MGELSSIVGVNARVEAHTLFTEIRIEALDGRSGQRLLVVIAV